MTVALHCRAARTMADTTCSVSSFGRRPYCAAKYLDQAPVQMVDVHEGLDNTLVILRNKLKNGITIQREYSADLPPIEAYGEVQP